MSEIIEMPKEINGYIKIENQGEMDINALLLLGATSKRGDATKIGYFGSGLKYALAVLLKNNIPFHIFAGEKEIKVTTSKQTFRGNEVQVIKVNNRLTSLTTDMGPDWEPWFAVREIYCNAIDEGYHNITIAPAPEAKKGMTTFFIKFDYKLAELFSNWNLYFADKRSDIIVQSPEHGTTMFSGNAHNTIIYRKGVRCFLEKQKSLYHYDLNWIKINESRVIESTWDLSYYLPQYIAKIATREIVAEIFNNYKGTFESNLKWDSVHSFNQNWLDVIDGREIIIDSVVGYFLADIQDNEHKFVILPNDIATALKSYFGERVKIKGMTNPKQEGLELQMSKQQLEEVAYAVEFLKKGDIEVTSPIVLYKFATETTLGEYKNDRILLSPKLFKMGRRELIKTILEEHSHKDSGAGDKTRAFQDYLFNQWVALLEEKLGNRV